MAADRLVRRALLYGIAAGGLALTTIPSAAPVAAPAARAAAEAPFHGGRGVAPEALFQLIRGSLFCRSYPRHQLCAQIVKWQRACDRSPEHRLCAQADDDGFCSGRPDHPLCDDDRFCSRRPNHPLCDGEPPPSPS
jgi:hypothetical protein